MEDIKCFVEMDGFKQVVKTILATLDKGKSKRTRGPTLTTIAEMLVTAKDDKGDGTQVGRPLRPCGSDTGEVRQTCVFYVRTSFVESFVVEFESNEFQARVEIVLILCRNCVDLMEKSVSDRC